ncbi:Oxysterol-binding protein-domain-containing protein [Lentinula aciculospora]|uniref:Oxysterol-binding protein-domain-containing protein n=1 Tax=Lentinula aciculospora TaxID=153920 RepID=A0A9W8ZXV6_9AGAR|nr:Oxysterol-binding protein-domain-containing protein [Lentinula aciculospora]
MSSERNDRNSNTSQSIQSQSSLSQQPQSQSFSPSKQPQSPKNSPSPPPLKGYLLKYTNLAKGYNPRWFVLRGGVLSYYRRQEDETVASRGSISMRSVVVKVSPSDKLRFEVYSGSISPTASASTQKWYLKANHPVEAARWIGAIGEWKVWCQQQPQLGGQTATSPPSSSSVARTSIGSSRTLERSSDLTATTTIVPPSSTRTSISNSFIGGLSTIRKKRRTTRFADNSNSSFINPSSDVESTLHGIHSEAESGISGMSGTSKMSRASRTERVDEKSRSDYTDVSDADDDEDDDEDEEDAGNEENDDGNVVYDDNDGGEDESALPYSGTYEQQAQRILDQIQTINQFSSPSQSHDFIQFSSTLSSLLATYISMSSSRESHLQTNLSLTKSRLSNTRTTLSQTRKSLQNTRKNLRASERKRKGLEATVKQAKRAQKAWEESMKVVLEEEKGLEMKLKRTSRNFNSLKRGSKLFGPTSPAGGGFRNGEPNQIPTPLAEDGLRTPTVLGQFEIELATPPARMEHAENDEDNEGDDEEDEEEDEFFDAIESNNIPNLVVPEQLKQQAASTSSLGASTTTTTESFVSALRPPSTISIASTSTIASTSSTPNTPYAVYAAYAHLRTSLPLRAERPVTSLWSALKNSIGKDLTKISFPVYFNEPTSMLQRMAEDMEFSECLDIACQTPSPHLRIAYIAAFAMSNYSSTIGRIAKPFNPMLGETFEYVCLGEEGVGEVGEGGKVEGRGGMKPKQGKQGYRYFSEQVSHHPPISACWAESFGMVDSGDSEKKNGWRYYGEVDAQNRFMGRSFEIRPTGVAHINLRIPRAWATATDGEVSEYVDKDSSEEMVLEHYTWKKVTTNVSGFILGSPTIDHYGDMIITNHLTQDQCILTFKPRGWRGKDAYEIAGQVISAQGNIVYEIAGRWNSQLIMRPAGYDRGEARAPVGTVGAALNPDIAVSSSPSLPSLSSNVPSQVQQQYILLWRNTPKPRGTPFNLTPFALTLNDLPTSRASTAPPTQHHLLRPYLPPTDSRLRPDQRAFEMGLWDLANVLKGKQEEKQRATKRRKEKEMESQVGVMQHHHHQPRWFRAETDGDTGERVWMPSKVEKGIKEELGGRGNPGGKGSRNEKLELEYWLEKERVWKEIKGVNLVEVSNTKQHDNRENGKWKNVECIFIDEPEEMKDDY